MLDPNQSRNRQKRLLSALQGEGLDAVVVGSKEHVYYLSAHLPGWQHHAAMVLFADGRSWLVTANQPSKTAAAEQIDSYEANWMGTQRSEQPAVVAGKVIEQLKSRGAKRIGVDSSAVTAQVAIRFEGGAAPIDPTIYELRRVKDADELELMKVGIRCTEAMYRRARQIIEPGVPELKVYNELHAAAVETAGERLSDLLGNDYASGKPGGPARKDHAAQAGQIYILDLGPAYRGYFSDNARGFCVDRKPTDAQMNAWQAIVGSFKVVERMARPGVRCRDIFAAVDEHFKQTRGTGMPHHLGHGVGLNPHEAPHLNPKWDDVLLEGEFFTAEPGQYGLEINGGIRIENNYLVTKTGVQNLTEFSMELV